MNNPLRRNSPISAFRDTQHRKLFLDKLIKVAKRLRATSIEQAQGTCLTSSLELCLIAREYEVPVELAIWPIKNDPIFCEHWAVRINQRQVIDLTRIQVDNAPTSEVLFSIDDYPANYQIPRFYKTAPLLSEYEFFKNSYSGKLPPQLIKNIRKLMLRQDLNNASHFRNLPGMSAALFCYARFRMHLYLTQLEERLHHRKNTIQRR